MPGNESWHEFQYFTCSVANLFGGAADKILLGLGSYLYYYVVEEEMKRSWYASYCAGGRAMASFTVSRMPLAQGAQVRLRLA